MTDGDGTLRAPLRPRRSLPVSVTELTGPVPGVVRRLDADLTRQHPGQPLGERIVVAGKVSDGEGRPVPGTLVEIWQANAAGRYAHDGDQHPAPLDPNFTGVGRCLTDAEGRYRFTTIKPGPSPLAGRAWRSACIHFSLLGRAFTQRLVTAMHFPGDPLAEHDPVLAGTPGRERLVAGLDLDLTEPGWAVGYRFDIVLRRAAAPVEGP
jgi:protocatechuate 3,4-dioxygenase beta subunit